MAKFYVLDKKKVKGIAERFDRKENSVSGGKGKDEKINSIHTLEYVQYQSRQVAANTYGQIMKCAWCAVGLAVYHHRDNVMIYSLDTQNRRLPSNRRSVRCAKRDSKLPG